MRCQKICVNDGLGSFTLNVEGRGFSHWRSYWFYYEIKQIQYEPNCKFINILFFDINASQNFSAGVKNLWSTLIEEIWEHNSLTHDNQELEWSSNYTKTIIDLWPNGGRKNSNSGDAIEFALLLYQQSIGTNSHKAASKHERIRGLQCSPQKMCTYEPHKLGKN